MSTILKGANFKGTKDSSKKKVHGHYKPKQDGRQGLKGPGTSAAGPFGRINPRYNATNAWDGAITAKIVQMNIQ